MRKNLRKKVYATDLLLRQQNKEFMGLLNKNKNTNSL